MCLFEQVGQPAGRLRAGPPGAPRRKNHASSSGASRSGASRGDGLPSYNCPFIPLFIAYSSPSRRFRLDPSAPHKGPNVVEIQGLEPTVSRALAAMGGLFVRPGRARVASRWRQSSRVSDKATLIRPPEGFVMVRPTARPCTATGCRGGCSTCGPRAISAGLRLGARCRPRPAAQPGALARRRRHPGAARPWP